MALLFWFVWFLRGGAGFFILDGDVQKVKLAVVELVEGLNDRYSHYLLESPVIDLFSLLLTRLFCCFFFLWEFFYEIPETISDYYCLLLYW